MEVHNESDNNRCRYRKKSIHKERGSSTGLSGVVWIDADTHTWQNGVATMSLTVTLKQMMDTKEG